MTSVRPAVLLGMAVGAILYPFNGEAQTPPEADETSVPSGRATGLEEIVVTATKQAEPLSKVPVSVSAYNQETLDAQGSKSMADIAALTPGVDFSYSPYGNGSWTTIVIRGISSTSPGATTGVYIDETPVQVRFNYNTIFGNPYPQIFDLDRVELLRGPQGTLFGAGSEGGTVRFITPEPSLTDYSGYARTEVAGTVDGDPSYEAGVAVGGPIVEDELGFRASAWYRMDGGYVDRVNYETGQTTPNANWQESTVLRGALTFAPSDDLKITPSLDYQKIRINDTSGYWEALSNPSAGDFVNGNIIPEPSSDDFYLLSVKVEGKTDWFNITSITSYFFRHAKGAYDDTTFESAVWAGIPYPTIPGQVAPQLSATQQNIVTEEVRLASPDPTARLNWVVGAFYSNSRQADNEFVTDRFLPQLIEDSFGLTLQQFFGVGLADGRYTLVSEDRSLEKQIAGFGEVHYEVIDDLKLTLGLRVARTDISYFEQDSGPVFGPLHSFTGTQKDTPVTPKFGLSYQADDKNLYYATISEGFRVGGINGPIPSSPPCAASLGLLGLSAPPASYNSDTLWNYEVGAKNRVLGGALELDSSLFYDVWNNIQENVALPACGGLGFVGNLGTAVSKGFDLSAQYHATPSLTFGLALGYTYAAYTNTIGSGSTIVVSKGNTLGGAPWIATLTSEYDFTILGDKDAYIRGQYEFHARNGQTSPGQNSASISFDPDIPLGGDTHLVDLRAGVAFSGFDVSVFVNNALNSYTGLRLSHPIPGDTAYYNLAFRPLTVGLTGTYRF